MKNTKRLARSDGANAFIAEPGTQHGAPPDDLAEYLGENFIASATGAEDADEGLQNDVNIEELGGPFVETDAAATFGDGDDMEAERPNKRNSSPSVKASSVGKRPRDRTIGSAGIAASPSGSKARRARG